MKKKRRHVELEQAQCEQPAEEIPTPKHTISNEYNQEQKVLDSTQNEVDGLFVEQRKKKFKQAYSRVSVDPSKRYYTPESRESWGPNVKGKKFRKEKGKKKRCPNAGVRIDGSVKSVRLDG